MVTRVGSRLGPVGDTDLGKNIDEVGGDGLGADEELVGYLFVGLPRRDKPSTSTSRRVSSSAEWGAFSP